MISKIINRSILILFALTFATFAQQKIFVQQAAQEKNSVEESYPVDARPYLERFNKEHSAEIEKLTSVHIFKKINWNFQKGDKYTWQSADLRSGKNNGFYQVTSTCRAVGTHCYVFVQDSAWVDINNKVNQTVVDSVQLAFDARTPANPYKGIYDTDVETFGNPSTSYDPKIIILLLDIRDGYKGTGGYVAGYFYSTAETINNAHIYFLDSNPLPFLKQDGTINSSGLTTGMKTTAHEFQHMIHWNYLQNQSSEDTFFNEGWSLAAEVINGYSLYSQSYFLSETNQYLLYWRQTSDPKILNDYSRAARFALYLKEQFGIAIFKNYLSRRISGVTGLNQYMASVGSRTFSSVLTDWWLANYLNENVNNTHPEWAYTYTPLTKVTSNVTYTNPNITNGTTSGVYRQSTEYITFNSCLDLKITFNTSVNANLKIKAIKIGAGTKVIEDINSGIEYSIPDLGTTYSSITFMIYHDNYYDGTQGQPGPFVYSFNSSGTAVHTVQEIAYDSTEPVGVYVISVGDTVAVRFDGLNGTHLDSIRVALRNTVPMQGGVWRAATSGSSYLGNRLAGPFNVAGKTTPVYNQSTKSYPIPYPNWIKVDLRSNNIDASTNFVVGFIIDGVYVDPNSPTNRVMHTSVPGTSAYHSYTYLNNPSSGIPGWYYIGDGTNISLYLIRAYVSSGPTGVNEPIELLPSSFALEQNYPNPFNPTTVISWQLSVGSLVTLKIYDMLGREVTTLVNEFKQAGKYNSQFSIQNSQFSSGVYLYRLTADNKVETKKMILMK